MTPNTGAAETLHAAAYRASPRPHSPFPVPATTLSGGRGAGPCFRRTAPIRARRGPVAGEAFHHPTGAVSDPGPLPLPMIALADVAVTVTDARASAAWWEAKLGFVRHTVDGPSGHAVMIAPPGDRFVLHLCAGIAPVEAGNSGIAFVTDEIERWVERLTAAGVAFAEPYRATQWGGSAKFIDPDGNIFWLIGAPRAFVRQEARRRAPTPRPGRPRPSKPRASPARRRRSR